MSDNNSKTPVHFREKIRRIIFDHNTPASKGFDIALLVLIFLDFFVPEPATSESARDHWDRNLVLVTGVVSEEDFPTGEGIQFGFLSRAQSHMTYGRNEPALAHFEQAVTAAL